MDARLPDIARGTVSQHMMLPGGPVVALVSGGGDSTALLRLLASGAVGPLALSVVHVDHMLRGAASAGDAEFVWRTCEELSVPCRVIPYDVSAYAREEGLNLEDAGRRVRYRFAEEELDARCDAAGADRASGRIAVAHTFDDRMETFLMRVVKGSGSGALASIRHVRGRVVRPLLDARRADVVAYLRELGQPWREDETNSDTSRFRAWIRAEVLPHLLTANPRFPEVLAGTLAVLEDEDRLLDTLAREAAGRLSRFAGGRLEVDRPGLEALDPALRRRALRIALFDAFPEASRLERSHVEALLSAPSGERFARDLPGGIRAEAECDTLSVRRGGSEPGSLAPSLLDVPGTVDLGEGGRLVAEMAEPDDIDDDPMTALVDADTVSIPLTVDSVKEGDRIRPLGMRGRRKLSDLLSEASIPRNRRRLTPVVRSGDEIVWVAGVRMSEDHRVRPDTERALRLRWTGSGCRETP